MAAFAVGAAQAAPGARGLIVELKDAAEHVEDSPETPGGPEVAARHEQRVSRVVAEVGLAQAGAARGAPLARPHGRAAHVLEFGRTLAPLEVDAYLAQLRASPEVAWAEPNDIEQAQQNTSPSDPLFAGTTGQWWLHPSGGSDGNVMADRLRGVPGLQRAWTLTTGNTLVPVAVLDTGITSHLELLGTWWPGIDVVSDPVAANDGNGRDTDPRDPGDWVHPADRAQSALADCDVRDSSWHGTVVSGILAARTDNNTGVAAVGWQARLVPVRVAGRCGAEVADVIDGMRWAAGLSVSSGRGWLPRNKHPVRIINLSFAGNRPCNRAYQTAIDDLHARGVIVVAAAGNSRGAVMRPANCRGVVAVAALNRDGFKAHYSSFGAEVTVATVGGDNSGGAWGPLLSDGGLLSLFNAGITSPADGNYARSAGTSFATPIVAGTAALMLSLNPNLTAQQLITGLTVTARPHVRSPWLSTCSPDQTTRCLCTTSTCGAGMLDAEQALYYARDPEAYVPPARAAEVLDNPELAAAAGLSGEPLPRPGPLDTSDTGGGALSATWLALLALAVALLGSPTRRSTTAAPLKRTGGVRAARRRV